VNKVVFVGDKPSTKNLDPNVAFVGTRSYDTLTEWCNTMNIPFRIFVNSESTDIIDIAEYNQQGCIFVALGNKASDVLNRLRIDHHKLPHPSPRNFALNDKQALHEKLMVCKRYIYHAMIIKNLERTQYKEVSNA